MNYFTLFGISLFYGGYVLCPAFSHNIHMDSIDVEGIHGVY